MTKTNGKKRQSPSVERQLALALLRVIECLGPMDDLRSVIEAREGGAKFWAELSTAAGEAREILKTNNYSELETIATRVKRIQEAITKAVEANDGAALAKLGADLDRAKAGKPPLTTEKKTRVKTTPTEKKSRKKKGETALADPPTELNVPIKCTFKDCTWTGTGGPDTVCPRCGSEVAPMPPAESESKDA